MDISTNREVLTYIRDAYVLIAQTKSDHWYTEHYTCTHIKFGVNGMEPLPDSLHIKLSAALYNLCEHFFNSLPEEVQDHSAYKADPLAAIVKHDGLYHRSTIPSNAFTITRAARITALRKFYVQWVITYTTALLEGDYL